MSRPKPNPQPDWIDPDEWRKSHEWARIEILHTVRIATKTNGGCGASWLVTRLASGVGGPPDAYCSMSMDKRRRLVWAQIHRLIEKKQIEQFDRRIGQGDLMHLRTSNVLDQMLYAVDKETT